MKDAFETQLNVGDVVVHFDRRGVIRGKVIGKNNHVVCVQSVFEPYTIHVYYTPHHLVLVYPNG